MHCMLICRSVTSSVHTASCVCVRYTEKEAPQETHRQNANEEWLFHLFMGQC
jgi:hypothetical protein